MKRWFNLIFKELFFPFIFIAFQCCTLLVIKLVVKTAWYFVCERRSDNESEQWGLPFSKTAKWGVQRNSYLCNQRPVGILSMLFSIRQQTLEHFHWRTRIIQSLEICMQTEIFWIVPVQCLYSWGLSLPLEERSTCCMDNPKSHVMAYSCNKVSNFFHSLDTIWCYEDYRPLLHLRCSMEWK